MKRKTTNKTWDEVFQVLRQHLRSHPTPSLNVLTEGGSSPWQILVATILSLRTRDAVTLAASLKLFERAPGPSHLRALSDQEVADLIFPVGFYRTKARQLKTIAQLLAGNDDLVPQTRQGLLQLPGVGPKTANLVLNLAFHVEAICVDTHVHRIPNRLGWIATASPEHSEVALEALWPRHLWIEANSLFVAFGQATCLPLGPRCSICPFRTDCPQNGVARSHR